VKLIFLTAKKS